MDVEEVRKLLSSEKITHRKKGRVECESNLFRDRNAIAANATLTMSLLHSAMDCEITEINLAETKSKAVELDLSVFFRNVVKYCVTHGQVKSHKTGFVFEHIMDILCNEDLPVNFKANHKQALGLFLHPSIIHSISFEKSMKMSIIYLKDIMVDSASLKDPLNHKLLRATSMCMFQEECCQLLFLSNVLNWFVKLLQQTSEDPATHSLVTATVAECTANFIKFQHLNLYSTLCKDLEFVFQAVVKYLSSFQFREQHKDAYLSYIDAYLQLCTEYHELTPPRCEADLYSSALVQLSEYLLSEAHLKSLVTSARTHPGAAAVAGKDSTYVLLQDVLSESRWSVQFTVLARLVRRLGMRSSSDRSSSTDGVGACGSAVSAQTPLGHKTQRSEVHATANKRPRIEGNSTSSGGVSSQYTPARVPHTPHTASKSNTYNSRTSGAFSLLVCISSVQLDSSSAVTATSRSGSSGGGKQSAAMVLEGYLTVLLVSLRLYGEGALRCGGDVHGAGSTGGVKELAKHLVVIKQVLLDVLQHACETQLLGAVLLVLVELCLLHCTLIDCGSGQSSDKEVWTDVLSVLLTHPKCAPYTTSNAAVRKDTIASHALRLVHCILRNGVKAHTSATVSVVRNPLLIESSVCFEYIAALVHSGGDLPAGATAAVLGLLQSLGHTDVLHILNSDDNNTNNATTSVVAVSANTTLTTQYGTALLVGWLYAQLAPLQTQSDPSTTAGSTTNSSGSSSSGTRTGIQFIASSSCLTRVPVSMLGEYSSAIHALVLAVLSPTRSSSCSGGDEFVSAAKIVATRSNPLHWLEPISHSPHSTHHNPSTTTPAPVVCSEDSLQTTATLLHTLHTQLLSIAHSGGLRNEASEQFNAWQSVVLLTLSTYAALLHVATDVYAAASTPALHCFVLAQVCRALTLVKAVAVYTEKKIVALKLVQVAEYFDSLAAVLIKLQPAWSLCGNGSNSSGSLSRSASGGNSGPSNNTGDMQQLGKLRTACGQALLKCVRSLHALVLSKANKSPAQAMTSAAQDDDEFLEQHAHSSRTNRENLDVDFDDPAAETGSNSSSGGTGGGRAVLVFSAEQLQAFLAVSRCVVALQESSSVSTALAADRDAVTTYANTASDEVMTRAVDLLFTTESYNTVTLLHADCESKLLLAQALTSCSSSGTASLHLIAHSAWHAELGSLGYCRVLYIILLIISQSAFWATADRTIDFSTESVLGQIVDFVLPQDNAVLEQYLSGMWQCRHAQLQCVSMLMQHADVTNIKSSISGLFVSAFSDIHVRVRLCASECVHLLLPLFKNTFNVYQSLLKGAYIPLVHSANGASTDVSAVEKPLEIVALVRSVAAMGSSLSGNTVSNATTPTGNNISTSNSSNTLVKQALLDLFKLCCSRASSTAPAHTVIDYSALLSTAVHTLSSTLHYTHSSTLVREYVRFLLYEWLLLGQSEFREQVASQLGSQSKNNSSVGLTLANFPYHLLYSAGVADPSDANGASTQKGLKAFLRAHSATVVPVICQIEDTRYRWACLLQYAAAAGYGSTDRDVAVIVKRNICAIKALEITLLAAGHLRAETRQDVHLPEEQQCEHYTTIAEKAHFLAQSVQDFVTRSASAAELGVYVSNKCTDIVCEVVLLQIAESLSECEGTGDSTVGSIVMLLEHACTQVGALIGVASLKEMFAQCNLLDLLSQLHCRLCESRRSAVNTAVLATLQMLVVHHPPVLQKCLLDGIVHVCHASVSNFPAALPDAVVVLDLLMTRIVEKHVRDDTKHALYEDVNAIPTETSSEVVLAFVPELLAECVLLLKYVAITLQSSREEGAGGALLVLINANRLDRQAGETDDFTCAYFSSSSHRSGIINTSSTSTIASVTLVPYTALQCAAVLLNGAVSKLLHHVSKTFNHAALAPLLPLPSAFLSSCLRKECLSYQEIVRTSTIHARIAKLILEIQRHIDGELVPLAYVWLQLRTITAYLIPDGTLPAGVEKSAECRWDRDVDLLSSFLSTLVGLCKHCAESFVATTGGPSPVSAVQHALQQTVLRLMGHFGAPDLLSLNHTKFPAQPGNLTKSGSFDPESIKQRLLLRVYSMLWTDPTQASVALGVMRDLTCAGYFPALQLTANARACAEVQLNEIVASFANSVIAREKIVSKSGASCWDDSLWNTQNQPSYNAWLCELTHRLIAECFVESQSREDPAPVSNEHPIIKSTDPLIALTKPICLMRPDFAESLFPLVIHLILRANGVNSYAHQALSGFVVKHLLSPQCQFVQATQLGCNLLTYLMRQDVDDFLAQCARASPRASPRAEPSKVAQSEWALPFSYVLDVDLKFAAKAATRCQLVCTALLFAEMSDEADRHAGDNKQVPNIQDLVIGPNRAAVSHTGLHNLLMMPIYQGIHDPDAMYGIDLCSSLELQALMFSRKGRWMEALSTYEGIIQAQTQTRTGRGAAASMVAAEMGIATALGGLGAQYTLSRYSSSGNAHSVAGHTLSQWHPSMNDLTSFDEPRAPSPNSNFFSDVQAARSQSSCPALAITAESRVAKISAVLVDIQKMEPKAVVLRVAQCSSVLFADILTRMGDETAINVLADVAHAQQLTEICEVCEVLADPQNSTSGSAVLSSMSSTGAASRSGTALLLNRWQARHHRSGNTSAESPFALRATLLRKLLDLGRTTAYDAMQCLSQGEIAGSRSANTAHSITPQVYKFWNDMTEHIQAQRGVSANNFSECLLTANLAYFECRLLWAKGLKDASISNINGRVIVKLKNLLTEMSAAKSAATSRALGAPSGRKASASTEQEEAATYFEDQLTESRAKNLLSEALCIGGEWVSTKRAATGTEILDEYFDPAVQFATGATELIRAYTTLASFHARLHQNLKAKVQSAEWLQGARVLADRITEFEECRQLQEQLRRDMSRAPGSETANGIDPRTLYRHTATLKKEIELDTKEREAVEQSVNRYLVAAVTDFAKVLELSKEADVDCVFRLVQLWLSNHNNVQINALMDDIITSVPSYKFAPLSYQILSRLGGVSDEQASPGSANSQVRLAEKLKDTPAKTGLNRTSTACSTFSGSDSEEGESGFQLALCRMVLKLCNEHPHHILSQLFALAHEREFSDDSAVHVKKNLSISRLETATMLVSQLQTSATNPAGRELVISTRTMLLAYIDLANANTTALQKVGRTKGIKFKEVQGRGKRFNELMGGLSVAPAVITLSLPLSPINDYSGIVRIEGFQQTFSITDNGISRPKIISCQGTDGKQYVQLVKGGDDMRQDAVMQQVFANVNYTLNQDEETQKRNLGIRTYKIIPTTPQTGILEWVQNTAAFGSLLCDREHGAHGRYYPADWSHGQCREHLKDVSDNADKLKRYQEVCARFHPAFRFFFLERYADPVAWVASRLAYSRSVASNSIIGYILGIGDRHAHNILLDTVTAEVVHIDFGIVFEQGKGLGTPETVPFRLTRDVVDGMGVTACEGTFRRSCEEVLRVLRDNSLQIMTILEVVIHDPLYKWSLSPLQARMKQNLQPDYHADLAAANARSSSRGKTDKAAGQTLGATVATKGGNFGKDAAERTLLRVLHKLQGQEDPSSGEALSVEGQVDLLINEARSPHNLSKLFPGWAPWL